MFCLRSQSAGVVSRLRLPIRAVSSQMYTSPMTRSTPYPNSSSHLSIRTACSKSNPTNSQASMASIEFWSSRALWKRAGINTFRCLIGCSLGDFSSMWFLQLYYPEIGTGLIMGISMVSGLSTSMLLETVLLRWGRDGLSWMNAARTAAGMSFVSMLGMESVQNMVDYHLTSGVVMFDDPKFWMAAVASAAAGFLAPLPYNYTRLRKYGKACH